MGRYDIQVMPILRVFDASFSAGRSGPFSRPIHRGGGGPARNDVLRALEETAAEFEAVFVGDPVSADVAITNSVWPEDFPSIPKVKRLDGAFWRQDLQDRNRPHVEAASVSGAVVFISEHSRAAHQDLCPPRLPKDVSVVLNAADPRVFPRLAALPSFPTRWWASATDWSREEKRLPEILALARLLEGGGGVLLLAGRCASPLPENVVPLGYLSEAEASAAMASCHAHACLAFRDACPKTLAQAVSSGLPVLGSSTGGIPEQVRPGASVLVQEARTPVPRLSSPRMDAAALEEALDRFLSSYRDLARAALEPEPECRFYLPVQT